MTPKIPEPAPEAVRVGRVGIEFRQADGRTKEAEQREHRPAEHGAGDDAAPTDQEAAIEGDLGMALETNQRPLGRCPDGATRLLAPALPARRLRWQLLHPCPAASASSWRMKSLTPSSPPARARWSFPPSPLDGELEERAAPALQRHPLREEREAHALQLDSKRQAAVAFARLRNGGPQGLRELAVTLALIGGKRQGVAEEAPLRGSGG